MKDFMIHQNKHLDNDQIYDLFAVVLHTGTLNGGHYTAMVNSCMDKEWYEFNDHQVSKINKHDSSKLISNHAYILFYHKRGIDFDNIIDYSKIKNKLNKLNGKKKFDPESIEFPLIKPKSLS